MTNAGLRITRRIALPAIVLALCLGELTLLLFDRGTLVRVRNSLEYEVASESQFEWAPEQRPADFDWEQQSSSTELAARAQVVLAQVGSLHGDLPRALAIIRHLTMARGDGQPIMASLADAYIGIVDRKTGYCTDFTAVFEALAIASGLSVREWGFGVDGFAVGHAFSEVYDHELHQWVFVDPYNSFYVRDRSSGRPLSVLELRSALLQEAIKDVELVPVRRETFGFVSPRQALDYYENGADQMYMWWSNAVISRDRSPLVRLAAHFGRVSEHTASLVTGLHSPLRLIESPSNELLIRRLWRAKYEFLGLALLSALALVDLVLRLRESRGVST